MVVIKWVNKREQISFQKPKVWFVMGSRGSGKSSFLEHIGLYYLRLAKACIVDLFGSRDGENLVWLRAKNVYYAPSRRVLLLRSPDIKVVYKDRFAKGLYDTGRINDIPYNEFDLKHVDHYSVIISSNPLYNDIDEEYMAVNHVIDKLYQRYGWSRLVYVIVREAGNLYYSRLKISKTQKDAKANFIYLIRESRHMGLALGLDTIRFKAIDADVRAQIDYFIIKNMGANLLPEEMRWVYRYFSIIVFDNLPPYLFFIVTARSSLGLGYFPYPKFHKQEGENIFDKIGLEVKK